MQVLNIFRNPNTHELDKTALANTTWTLLYLNEDDTVTAYHFKITQTGLQLENESTHALPEAQMVDSDGWSKVDAKTYASVEAAIEGERIQAPRLRRSHNPLLNQSNGVRDLVPDAVD